MNSMDGSHKHRNELHALVPVNRIHVPSYDDILGNEARRCLVGYAPNPSCSVCHGIGFVYAMKDDGQPNYSKAVVCVAPDCLADAKQHWKESGQYLELRGVSSRLQTFEQFQQRAGTVASFRAFKRLAEGGIEKPLLLCIGGNGSGKTHLCQALTAALNRGGTDASYYRVPDLLKTLHAAMTDHSIDERLKSLASIGALILDDYGLEHETDWTDSAIEDVIDARWQEKRITVMTTNKDLPALPARISSRFGDTELSVVILNTGKDYRTGGK